MSKSQIRACFRRESSQKRRLIVWVRKSVVYVAKITKETGHPVKITESLMALVRSGFALRQDARLHILYSVTGSHAAPYRSAGLQILAETQGKYALKGATRHR